MKALASIALLLFCLTLGATSSKQVTNGKYHNSKEHSKLVDEPFKTRHKYKGAEKRFYREPSAIKQRNCAIMYRNEEPIGILQPFEKSYKLLPVNGEKLMVDVDDQNNVENSDDYSDLINNGEMKEMKDKYRDERYPSVFTQFKIDSRLDRSSFLDEAKAVAKRESLKPVVDNTVHVEEQLKSILDDMGLIESGREEEKREALKEDENLEQGTNKINLVREARSFDVNTDFSAVSSTVAQRDSFLESLDKSTEKLVKRSSDGTSCKPVIVKRDEAVRKKRQKPPIVEDLEKSGDLHLTGNKSPLAYVTTNPINEDLKLSDYEKRVERDIQNKISALKEEVKREIETLKSNENKDSLRKKRNVISTLIEEETSNINPALNVEEKLEPLVRKRRNVDEDVGGFQSRKLKQIFEDFPRDKRDANGCGSDSSHSCQESKHTCGSGNCENNQNEGECKNCHNHNNNGGVNLDKLDIPLKGKRSLIDEDQSYETEDYGEDSLVKRTATEENKFRNFLGDEDSYFVDLAPDVYEASSRQKRNDETFEDLEALHGGGPVVNHIVAIRARSMSQPSHSRIRRRIVSNEVKQPQQLIDMSDEDLFGALPQSFEGELSRYKRVKRGKK